MDFHPLVQEWFEGRFENPSPPQRKGWPVIQQGHNVLIAAPTGSGKTLSAFLCAIDGLVRLGLKGELQAETRIVYVSPLKALANDIGANLLEPLEEIQALASPATSRSPAPPLRRSPLLTEIPPLSVSVIASGVLPVASSPTKMVVSPPTAVSSRLLLMTC